MIEFPFISLTTSSEEAYFNVCILKLIMSQRVDKAIAFQMPLAYSMGPL